MNKLKNEDTNIIYLYGRFFESCHKIDCLLSNSIYDKILMELYSPICLQVHDQLRIELNIKLDE